MATTVKPLLHFTTKAFVKYLQQETGRRTKNRFTATTHSNMLFVASSSNSSSAITTFDNSGGGLFCNKSVKTYEPIERGFYGYGLPCLCLLGIIANVVNIIVLTDQRLSARTYTFLAFLAFADLVSLILYSVDLLAKIHFAGELWHEIYTAYIYQPIGSVSTTSSLMLTVAFTVDRFVHLQDPRIQTGKLTIREKNINRLISAGIVVLSAVINLPRLFPTYVDMRTGCKAFYGYASKTDGWFSVYSYARLAILNVGSIILLAIFNTLLIVFVHRSTARSHKQQRTSNTSMRLAAHHSQQRSLTLTLIAATLLALAGEVPSTLLNRTSAAVLWGSGDVLNRQPFRSLVLATYTLLLLEYSGNFFTYFLLNKRFHAILCTKLCPSWMKRSVADDLPTKNNNGVTTTNNFYTSSPPFSVQPRQTRLNSEFILENEEDQALTKQTVVEMVEIVERSRNKIAGGETPEFV